MRADGQEGGGQDQAPEVAMWDQRPSPAWLYSGTYIGDLAALTAILVRFEYLATHPLVRALENARHLASDKCCRAASACSVATSA